jgi:hypothetical protein
MEGILKFPFYFCYLVSLSLRSLRCAVFPPSKVYVDINSGWPPWAHSWNVSPIVTTVGRYGNRSRRERETRQSICVSSCLWVSLHAAVQSARALSCSIAVHAVRPIQGNFCDAAFRKFFLRRTQTGTVFRNLFSQTSVSPGSRAPQVSIVSGYGLDYRAIEVRSPAEAKGFFLYPLCPDRSSQPPVLWVPGSYPRG